MWFDDKNNVDTYMQMTEAYKDVIVGELFSRFIPKGSEVLELGMGPGKDLDLLAPNYKMTGSDGSSVFLDRYRKNHPDADLMFLDAVTMDTDRRFDCIFSNKVLQHLTRNDFLISLSNQERILNSEGILIHTFWYGSGTENYGDLLFNYYDEEELIAAFSNYYDVLECKRYKEEEELDSVYIVARIKE